MSLFKKRKTEIINLEIKEIKDKPIDDNIQMYSEKEIVPKDTFSMVDQITKRKMIIEDYHKLESKNNDLFNNYYICKIFSRVALKDKDFNDRILSIDKHINRIRKEYEELQKKIKQVQYDDNITEDEIEDGYNKVRELTSFHKDITENLNEARKKYYNHLKIATFNVCMNKTNHELEMMYKNLTSFLDEYKNLNEAAEFIYYNSGQLLLTTVSSLINCIKNSKNPDAKLYNHSFFLKSDDIITLELSEWIDLYNKIKFAIKMANDIDINNCFDFKDYYSQFEIRYLILMMHVESNKKSKQIVNFSI